MRHDLNGSVDKFLVAADHRACVAVRMQGLNLAWRVLGIVPVIMAGGWDRGCGLSPEHLIQSNFYL